MESSDIVSDGHASDRHRRWPVVVAVVAVGLVVGFRWFDHVQRQHEFVALLHATAAGDATIVQAEAQWRGTRDYTLAQLENSPPAGADVGLVRFLNTSAASGVTAVKATRTRVAAVRVLPWHGSIADARSADLDYLDTWIGYLDNLAHGGSPEPLPTDEMSNRFSNTEAALHVAAPTGQDGQRIDLVLSSEPPH